ncbi:hypothetical protein SCA6_012026 [Theobroma cacao]
MGEGVVLPRRESSTSMPMPKNRREKEKAARDLMETHLGIANHRSFVIYYQSKSSQKQSGPRQVAGRAG